MTDTNEMPPLPSSDKPSDAELDKCRYPHCAHGVTPVRCDCAAMAAEPRDEKLVRELRNVAALASPSVVTNVCRDAADTIERLAASRLSVPREGYCRHPANCMSTTCTCGMPLPKAPA